MKDDDKIKVLLKEGKLKAEILKSIDKKNENENYLKVEKECNDILEELQQLMSEKAVKTVHTLYDIEDHLSKNDDAE